MQKKKSGVKKCLEICAIKGGGVGPLMANAILNFHFDYLNPSLKRNQSGCSTLVIWLVSEPAALGGLLVGALTQSQEGEC